jgi:hypothetical protein
MTVPIKTFTGLENLDLSGTNGAGTVNGGGIQRDLLTLFAALNPEATRPDGATGGIKLENLVIGFWAALAAANIATVDALGTVKVPTEFIDSTTGLLKFTGITKSFADTGWLNYSSNAYTSGSLRLFEWNFVKPVNDINPPYFVHVWFANDTNGSGMWQLNGSYAFLNSAIRYETINIVSSMTATSCKLVLAKSVEYNNITYWTPTSAYFRAIAYKVCD